MKKLLFTILLIICTIIVSNIGAWIEYPSHRYNLLLIFAIYKDLFPEISLLIFINTSISLILFAFLAKYILLSDPGKNNIGNTGHLNIFQKIFSSKKDINKYGYAFLIRNIRILKEYLSDFGLNFSEGIMLAKIENKFIRTVQPLSTLILAPPGTGKTAGVIIPNLLICENSMMVHDPKGELYDVTANIRRNRLKQRVLFFDPADKDSLKFNIFHKDLLPHDKRDLRAYVMNVANIIFVGQRSQENANKTDNYFENAGKSTFVFFAQWLIYKNNQTSIPEIRSKILEDEDIINTVENMIKDNCIPPEIKEDGRGVLVASASENQWAGIMGQLKESLELYADIRIKNLINSTCDFTGDSLRKEKLTIFIKVRDKDRQRLKPIISLMLDTISTQLISKMPEPEDNQITFILDEFVRLGRMDLISDLPSVSRGYKLNFIFVAQDYEQISNTYGQSYISIFETNCAYKIIFRQNNYNTAERISKLIGNKTTDRRSSSKNQSNKTMTSIFVQGNSGNSESSSKEGIALISPQDILSLKHDDCLIIVQGHASKVILAKNPLYFIDPFFKKILNT